MDWTAGENVAEALAAIALGYGARSGREWVTSRQGHLSGYWLWVTYDKDDGHVWSIEVVRLGHRKTWKEEQLTGTVWRLYDRVKPTQCKRRWSFIGWHVDGVIEGVYKYTRDPAGSHGVIHVWQTDAGFDGIYVRLIRDGQNNRLSTTRDEAPTQWRRLPERLPQPLRDIVDQIPAASATDAYPWRVRRKLDIKTGIGFGAFGGLPYTGVIIDNRLALEHTRARHEQAQQARDAAKPLLSEDDLGLSVVEHRSSVTAN